MAFFPLLPALLGQVARSSLKRQEGGSPSWSAWVSDPRNSVLAVLILALVLGGGRKLLQAHRARRAVAKLVGPDVRPEDIAAVAGFGREGLPELFQLLEPQTPRPLREAAGAALASLWAHDQLISEEERAIVTRGYEVHWHARRRYPRALRVPFPVIVTFGLPFLREPGPGVRPSNLEWSVRVAGSERATLERFGPWQAGPGRLTFTLEPGDFASDGPHRLVFQSRVRTVGLTSTWELELPHLPFTFEFDPRLAVDSLLTLPDAARATQFAQAVRLERPDSPDDAEPRFLPLGAEMALRNPPELVVTDPPCDLAHTAALEFEGDPDRFPCVPVLMSRDRLTATPGPFSARFPLAFDPTATLPLLDRPGDSRVRLHLTPDPHLGWADPDIRSLWPEPITTDWFPVRVTRT